tara:strand:- start:594 stop:1367 length:774 start_codon:yes stop_codon:yes gene_type:complete
MINKKSIQKACLSFGKNGPFDHCIIDNFFEKKIALKLESEFPDFNSKVWHRYDNAIEIKKVCNNWNDFPELTYQVFNYLNSEEFLKFLTNKISKKKLYSDIGLNGGGWHIHKKGGKLNQHLDYSLHPKLGLERKLNIIIYLNSNWKKEWKGNLGFWSNESNKEPGNLVREIEPKFNRAILFDTTQNSWHGLPEPVNCPKGEYRKSLAIYYLCKPSKKTDKRGKALFAPTEDQKNDKSVIELIKRRANVKTAYSTYRK